MNTVQDEINYYTNTIREAEEAIAILSRFGRIVDTGSVDLSHPYEMKTYRRTTRLTLQPQADEGPMGLVRQVLTLTRAPKAEKRFNEEKGRVEYWVQHDGVDVVIIGAAPERCKVELVEEPVVIPAQPARTEIRKRYRLVDPNCLGVQG